VKFRVFSGSAFDLPSAAHLPISDEAVSMVAAEADTLTCS